MRPNIARASKSFCKIHICEHFDDDIDARGPPVRFADLAEMAFVGVIENRIGPLLFDELFPFVRTRRTE